jgi:chemotaxis signal transduction protein
MGTTEMWVVVQLNAQPLAFPATLIKEVVPWQPLNPVPGKALGVMGLINLRGETLAVMDVLRMSGLGFVAQPSFMLVLDFPRQPSGAGGGPDRGGAVFHRRSGRHRHGRWLHSRYN